MLQHFPMYAYLPARDVAREPKASFGFLLPP